MTVRGGVDDGGGDEIKDPSVQPRVFFDVEIGGVSAGRVVFELFSNSCPKTAENFRQLCVGGGVGKSTEKPLHYKGTVFHRVIKDFMIQGGDFSNFNGTGGESIYGGTFEDENLQLQHDEPYLLSMANRGKDTNGSQFFILTQPAPHLNGIHVVFGKVVSGQAIIKQVEGLPVDRKSRPLSDVRVANCGELVLLKKKKEKKPKKSKKEASEDEKDKSTGEVSESEDESGKKRKRQKKESDDDEDNKEVIHPLVSLRGIDPDEIPKDPVNRFLTRAPKPEEEQDKDTTKDKDDNDRKRRSKSKSRSRSRSKERGRKESRGGDRSRFGSGRGIDNEGRKIKGRGRICFPRFTSRSRSKTPPHWKAETRKTISMKEFEEREKKKRSHEDELKRRQDERRKRHEEKPERPERETREKDRERDRNRDREQREKEEPPRSRGYASLRDRFKSSEVEDREEEEDDEDDEEEEEQPRTAEESSKIVDELANKLQPAGEGVVYYQHLFKSSSSTATAAVKKVPEPVQVQSMLSSALDEIEQYKNRAGLGVLLGEKHPPSLVPSAPQLSLSVPLDSKSGGEEDDEDEGPPGEDDQNVLAELRMRRELLKKRLKDWEESSGDEEKDKQASTQLQIAMRAELNSINQRQGLEVEEKKEAESSSSAARKSRSKSKSRDRDSRRHHAKHHRSRSRRRSGERDRGDRKERDRDHRRGGGTGRDSSRNRRDRDRERDRHRRSKRSRSKNSKSRSKSRSRSRGRRRR